MTLRPLYDETQLAQLAKDLSESVILTLPGGGQVTYEEYLGLARKLFQLGWRNVEEVGEDNGNGHTAGR